MKLFYREYGEGEPIIIVHGLFGMSDNWIHIAKILASEYKVFLLDIRNHGNSPHSPIHTYDAMGDDIFEFTRDKNIGKAILIGHSTGGKTVLQFALRFPEKTEKIIIVDISPAEYLPSPTFYEKALNHRKLLEKMLTVNLNDYRDRKELSKDVKDLFKDPFKVQLIFKNRKKDSAGFKWKINREVLLDGLIEIRKEIKPDKTLQNIRTLFIFGANSPYFRESDKKYIQKELPNAEIVSIPDSGHLLHIEQEKVFINSVLPFLNS